jgi:hypothetical protein
MARSNRHAAAKEADEGKTAANHGFTLAMNPSFPLSTLV